MVARVSSPTFVGRRRELARVADALVVAREGRPFVFLIAGEAGVGKTRFVREVTARAMASGARVLEGGCVQVGGDGLPFGPIIEALRAPARTLPATELDELLGAGRTDLARLMPGLTRMNDEPPSGGVDDSSAQGRLFEHVLGFLGRLAQRAPVVFVVEDIHWADRSTLDLLGFLTRNLREGSILLLASYRSDELHRQHSLRPFLAEQERAGQAQQLELHRFDRSELSDQLAAILGTTPDPELVRSIMTRSGGNAFYAEELLAASTSSGRLSETLRGVLISHVATLSEPTQSLIRVASAGGIRISPALLATITGTDQQRLASAFREAVDRHILALNEGDTEDRYAFRHALVQEALYAELLPGERTRLHAAFARALAAAAPDESGASHTAELAYHWQAARDLPRAFDAWIRAGVAAEAIYAEAEAREDFERALDLWDRVPDAAARAPLDRVDLLMHAAMHAEGPEPSRSVAYIREAIAFVDPTSDPARAGLLHERLGQYGFAALDDATTLAACQEAVRLVPAEPPSAARSRVLSGLGRFFAETYRPAEAAAICQEALAVAHAAGAREVETRALVPLGQSQVLLGDVDRGLATLRRAREVAVELGDVSEVAGAWAWLAGAFLDAARYTDAAAEGLEAEAYALRHGLGARWGPRALFYRAAALFHHGSWDDALETLTRARRYELEGIHELNNESLRLMIETLQGQFESANLRAPRVRFLAETRRSWFIGALPQLALWQNDPLSARAAVDVALAYPEITGRQLGWAVAAGIRAEADLGALARSRNDQRDLAQSRARGAALLARMKAGMEDDAGRLPLFRPTMEAHLATCEAEFSRLEARPDPELWASASAAWAIIPAPYPMAYVLMREGEATLALRHDRPRAARVLKESYDIAVRHGALPLKRAAEALAERAGIGLERSDVPTSGIGSTGEIPGEDARPVQLRRGGRYDLTPREREVLELVAAGHSNAEIGERLFISKKTASVHVATIKGKLGARSRVEIATDAIGLGLLEAPSPRT